MLPEIILGLVTFSLGVIGIAMILSFLISMSVQALLLLIERVLKLDIRFLIEATTLPGTLLRQTMTGIAASLLGYKMEARLFQGYGKDKTSIDIVRDIDSPIHALFIGLAPMLNLGLVMGLLATQTLITPLLPLRAQKWFSFLVVYLAMCVIVSGLPQVENVFFIFQSFVANSPWVIPLTLWGVVMAGITSAFLPRTFAILEFLVYEMVLLIYELRSQENKARNKQRVPLKQNKNHTKLENEIKKIRYFILIDD